MAGLRAGTCARRAVKAEGYFDVEVVVEGPLVKPPSSCFLDGVQVSTGATLGKRNLKWVQADQLVIRIQNTRTGHTAEVRPTPAPIELVTSFKPRPKAAAQKDHQPGDAQLETIARRIAKAPEKQILQVTFPDR